MPQPQLLYHGTPVVKGPTPNLLEHRATSARLAESIPSSFVTESQSGRTQSWPAAGRHVLREGFIASILQRTSSIRWSKRVTARAIGAAEPFC